MKLLIFDMDMCLFDTTSMGSAVIAPIVDLVRGKTPSTSFEDTKRDVCSLSPQDLAMKYGVPEAELFALYRLLEAPPHIVPYEDVRVLRQLPIPKALVTTGFYKLQRSKIDALGIDSLFQDVVIDDIEAAPRPGKKMTFAWLGARYHLLSTECMVLGDNPASELRAGKELGMATVQTLRPGVRRGNADFYIDTFDELPALIDQLSGTRYAQQRN